MGLLSSLAGLLRPPAPVAAEVGRAVDAAVDAIDPMLRAVPGYQARLAPATASALDYCGRLAASVPGPVELSRAAFAGDPFVHALFGSADDIVSMIGRSQETRRVLSEPGVTEFEAFYALMGMRRREKEVFGLERRGDVIVQDAPQRLLYFADHTLTCLCWSADAMRDRLKRLAFEGLIEGFATHVEDLRGELAELRSERDMAHARERIEAPRREQLRHHVRELDERLGHSAAALRPDKLIAALAESLQAPEPLLRLETVRLRVDAAGVLVPDGAEREGAATLEFPELTSRDRRRWLVLAARIPRDEVLEAAARFEDATRHIII